MKVIDSLAYILHFALITSEQIYNAFVIAVETMINNNRAREGITFCHINAHLATITITFK